jgi:hypothetical protein
MKALGNVIGKLFKARVVETKVVSSFYDLYRVTKYSNGTEDKVSLGSAFDVTDDLGRAYWQTRQSAGEKPQKVAIWGQERTRFLTGYILKPTVKTTLLVTERGRVYRIYTSQTRYVWGEHRARTSRFRGSRASLYILLTEALANLGQKKVA